MTRRIIPHGPDAVLDPTVLMLAEIAFAEGSGRPRFGDGGTPGGNVGSFLTDLVPLDDRLSLVEGTVTSGRLGYALYSDLAANTTAADGTIAEVPVTDTGTHTDPVSSATVNNSGVFKKVSAGWQRLYDVDAASALQSSIVAEQAAEDAQRKAGFDLRSDAQTFAASKMASGQTTSVSNADAVNHAAVAGEFRLDGAAATPGDQIPNEGVYTWNGTALLRTGSTQRQLTAALGAAATASVATLISPLVIGRPTSVATGTVLASQQSYVFATPVSQRGTISQVQAHFAATGALLVCAVSLVAGVFIPRRGSQRVALVTATGDQTYNLSSPIDLQPGERLQVTNRPGGMLRYITAAGDSGGHYSANASLVTNATLVSNVQLQIRFIGQLIGDTLAGAVSIPDAADTAITASYIGASLAAPNEVVVGQFGTVNTTIVGDTSAYANNVAQSGKPTGVELELTTGGSAGELVQVASSGEVLAVVPIAYFVGANYFDAAALSSMVNHPSWLMFFVPSATGGNSGAGGRQTYIAAAGNTISFTFAQSHNVGDTVTFNAASTGAVLMMRTYSTKPSILDRVASVEAASGNSARPVPLAQGYVPALLGGGALNHFITYGQSNSNGTDALSLLSTTPSVRHYKFGPSTRASKAGLSGASAGAAFDGTLMPLVEDTITGANADTNMGETCLSSLAKSLTRRVSQTSRETPIFLMSAAGKGATGIAVLASTWLPNLQEHIVQGIARAKALGVDYQLVGIPMDHGEADNVANVTGATYYATAKTMMETIQTFYEAQTAAAGGSVTPKTNKIMWLWSTATKQAAATSQKGVDSVANAVLNLCENLPYCVYYSPAYRFPYINVSHHTAQGQVLKGPYLSRAVAQMVAGYKPDRIRWGNVTVNGTVLTINLTAPTAIQLSSALVGATTQYGLAVEDATGTVALSGFAVAANGIAANGQLAYRVTCNLARALGSSPMFRAGKDFKPGANPELGAYTNVQDSTSETATLVDGTTHVLAHFAPPVTIPITTYE